MSIGIIPGKKDSGLNGYRAGDNSFINRLMEGAGFGHNATDSPIEYRKPATIFSDSNAIDRADGVSSYGQFTGRTYSSTERYGWQITSVLAVVGALTTSAYTIAQKFHLVS